MVGVSSISSTAKLDRTCSVLTTMRAFTDSPMNAIAFSSVAVQPAAIARPTLLRNAMIALGVVALHAGFIWTLQSGLRMRTETLLVTAEVLSQFVDPPVPRVAAPALPVSPSPRRPPAPSAQKKAIFKVPLQLQPPSLTVAAPTPALDTPLADGPPPLSSAPAAAIAGPAPASLAGPPALQQPSSNADYLQNPKPAYPPQSERLGETGKVVYKVWIGPDGKAEHAELVTSSGFLRLDKAAYETVMRWRYVPGRRNGVAETMPFNVPINWELRN